MRPIAVILIALAGITVNAQDVQLKGLVMDAKTGEPLPGTNVYIHETGNGTVTDAGGEFILIGLKPGIYHLHASFISYEPYAEYVEVKTDNKLNFHTIYLEPTSIELKNFVVESNTSKTGSVKSSQLIETADKSFIEKQGGNTFANTLEKIPGLSSMNVGVGIAKPVIRGMSFNRVSVTDNGIKQEGQQWGADHGLELDQFNVERVEILKGPSSLLYGSDAMAGVINILPPLIPQEGKLNTEALGVFRSNNSTYGTSALVEGNKKKNFFRFRTTYLSFGDYKVPADSFVYNSYVLPIYNQRLKNTAGNEFNVSASAGILRNWGTLRLTVSDYRQEAGLFPGATGIPRAYQLTDDGNERNIDLPKQDNRHFKSLLNLNIKLKKGWLENDWGYQQNDRKELSVPHAHGNVPNTGSSLALGLNLKTLTLNSRFHRVFSPRLKTIFGLSVQHMDNKKDGFEYLIPDYRSFSSGLYAFTEFHLTEKATLSSGARFDFATVDLTGYDSPIYNSNLDITGYWHRSPDTVRNFYNWSAAIGLSLEPRHEINIKFNLGRSFRIPTAPELAENGIHHGTFRHEMGDSTLRQEVGYQLDAALILHNDKFISKLTPYFNYFDNYIFLRPAAEFSSLPDAGQIYRYTQAEALHTGFELYAEYHLIESLHLETTFDYIYNYNLDTYLPLPFTPPPSGTVAVEYDIGERKKMKEFVLGAEVQHYLSQNRVDRNEKTTPGYTLFHASLGTEIRFKNWAIHVYLKGNNLFNTAYMNHISRYRQLNLPEQGRNFTLLLKIPVYAKI